MTNNKQQTIPPKEEAQELTNKFALGGWGKEHALTCVDAILIAIQDLPINEVNWDYWQQVKKEIEKL
jgi:hypothetical protein